MLMSTIEERRYIIIVKMFFEINIIHPIVKDLFYLIYYIHEPISLLSSKSLMCFELIISVSSLHNLQ